MSSYSKQRWLIIGLLISNALLIAALIFGHPSRMRGTSPGAMIIERLGFDGDQSDAFGKLIIKHQTGVRELDAKIKEVNGQLYAGLGGASVDESALLGQLAIFQAEIQKGRLDHFREVKQLCTPEQLPKFNELTKELQAIFTGPRMPPPGSPGPGGAEK